MWGQNPFHLPLVTATETTIRWLYSMAHTLSLILSLLTWSPLAVHAVYSFHDRCLSFTPEAYIYNSSRHVLTYVPAGTNLTLPDNDPTCARPSILVAVGICRVGLSIPTSNRSSVSFELWLPEDWSDRLLVTGNGGIDGCESFSDPFVLQTIVQYSSADKET